MKDFKLGMIMIWSGSWKGPFRALENNLGGKEQRGRELKRGFSRAAGV
jgi:hypothetical protein